MAAAEHEIRQRKETRGEEDEEEEGKKGTIEWWTRGGGGGGGEIMRWGSFDKVAFLISGVGANGV